jgi:hypothetical protein
MVLFTDSDVGRIMRVLPEATKMVVQGEDALHSENGGARRKRLAQRNGGARRRRLAERLTQRLAQHLAEPSIAETFPAITRFLRLI